MNEIVFLKKEEVLTNSLVIANGTNNEHRAIKQLINKYKNDLEDFGKVRILNDTLETKGGKQKSSLYLLNEEQATFLITLLRNNKIVVSFKKELVKQFYNMRKFILEKQSAEWKETREIGKLTRKSETDIIKQLIEYANNQGSKNSRMLYIIYSKLANRTVGIDRRDKATIKQLNSLEIIENIILNTIKLGMLENKHYKEIYRECKTRLENFTEIAYLTA